MARKSNQNHRQPAADLTISERRTKVIELIRDGMTYAAIAEQLNCSPATVANDKKAILAEWRDLYKDKIDDWILLQMSRYEELLRGVWPTAKQGKKDELDSALKIMGKMENLLGVGSSGTPLEAANILQIIWNQPEFDHNDIGIGADDVIQALNPGDADA